MRIEDFYLPFSGAKFAFWLFRRGGDQFSHRRVVARNDDALSPRHACQQFRKVRLGVCNLKLWPFKYFNKGRSRKVCGPNRTQGTGRVPLAKAYLGRERRAWPHHSFLRCRPANPGQGKEKQSKHIIFGPGTLGRTWGPRPVPKGFCYDTGY
jgi:hypothetical protein